MIGIRRNMPLVLQIYQSGGRKEKYGRIYILGRQST